MPWLDIATRALKREMNAIAVTALLMEEVLLLIRLIARCLALETALNLAEEYGELTSSLQLFKQAIRMLEDTVTYAQTMATQPCLAETVQELLLLEKR